MKIIGAAEVEPEGQKRVWCHYSKQDDTTICRKLTADAFEILSRPYMILRIVHLNDCKNRARNHKTFGLANIDAWREILKSLTSSADLQVEEKVPNKVQVEQRQTAESIAVPICRMRGLYDRVKELNKSLGRPMESSAANSAKKALATEYAKDEAAAIKKIWNASHNEILKFKNRQDWRNIGKRKQLEPHKGPMRAINTTNDFAAFVQVQPLTFDHNRKTIEWRYVTRELSPLTTRGGFREGGLPASSSGSGGADLILLTPENHFAITEVKVRNDSNAFYALIQALTYAVEFSTPSQIGRLRDQFKDLVCNDSAPNVVDVGIILINRSKTNTDPTLDVVREIVLHLNCSKARCKGLGQITLLNWEVGSDCWQVTR